MPRELLERPPKGHAVLHSLRNNDVAIQKLLTGGEAHYSLCDSASQGKTDFSLTVSEKRHNEESFSNSARKSQKVASKCIAPTIQVKQT
jgi:hypothetical protein